MIKGVLVHREFDLKVPLRPLTLRFHSRSHHKLNQIDGFHRDWMLDVYLGRVWCPLGCLKETTGVVYWDLIEQRHESAQERLKNRKSSFVGRGHVTHVGLLSEKNRERSQLGLVSLPASFLPLERSTDETCRPQDPKQTASSVLCFRDSARMKLLS